MRTRTKTICTIGPAVASEEKILQLIDAGMNVARLNFSHGTHEEHHHVIEIWKKARTQKNVPLPIMLDTQGPEIRLGDVLNDQIPVAAGQRLWVIKDPIRDAQKIQITPPVVVDFVQVGMTFLCDDGYLIAKIIEKNENGFLIELQNSGVIKSHKSVHIPGLPLELPAMTEQDARDIAFGCREDIDIIAASFIRSAEHVQEIRRLLVKEGKPNTMIIAKIESALGVKNFDQILEAADGIMVARGDLGVELPLKQVPILQKMMIKKCYTAFKPVVTATQMLESMIKNPRPTRAEVSDVANAIYDSTSSVMLSGETAVGQYPIEALTMMKSVIEEAENAFNYEKFFEKEEIGSLKLTAASVALATVKTAYTANAKAIFTFTESGFSARLLSRFRPKIPIIALTSNPKTYRQLDFSWGVIPVEPQKCTHLQEAFAVSVRFALKHGLVKPGDTVIVTAGSPFGVSGSTNMMMIDTIPQ
jgi:pyruvate kinase